MRILICPLVGGRGYGPITRSLAVAEQAILHGHDVAIIATTETRDILSASGAQIYNLSLYSNRIALPQHVVSVHDQLAVMGYSDLQYVLRLIDEELNVLDEFKPDLVFSEFQPTIRISTWLRNLPLFSTATYPYHPDFVSEIGKQDLSKQDTIIKVFNSVLRVQKLDKVIGHIAELCFLNSEKKIVPTPLELEPDLLNATGYEYVGSLLSTFIEAGSIPKSIVEFIGDDPVAFIYLSAGGIKPSQAMMLFSEVARTIYSKAGVKSVLATGPHSIMDDLEQIFTRINLKKNPIRFVENLPGMTILTRSSIVITRGGPNTLTGGILAGIPSLVMPSEHAEPHYFGKMIEKHKLGLLQQTASYTSEDIAKNVLDLIQDTEITTSIQNVASETRRLGGKNAVIKLIEEYN
jgi:UDP:flavonoid glycosyltransferase YjiC (YdhE family)